MNANHPLEDVPAAGDVGDVCGVGGVRQDEANVAPWEGHELAHGVAVGEADLKVGGGWSVGSGGVVVVVKAWGTRMWV